MEWELSVMRLRDRPGHQGKERVEGERAEDEDWGGRVASCP